MKPARLIVNADDFGLSPGVNRGILTCFRDGILSSTTMLVNMRGFDDAVETARRNPDLPLGIHLSLLWGRPLSEPAKVPSLIVGDGEFPRGLGTLATRYFLGRLALDQVREEFKRQIEKFLGTGLTPTHVDTHKHIHSLPGVLQALLEATSEFGIDRVRFPLELDSAAASRPPGRSRADLAKRGLIRFLCGNKRGVLKQAGVKVTDHFVGISYTTSLDEARLGHVLRNLEQGTTELMCHPGYRDEQPDEYTSSALNRERELAALTAESNRTLVASSAIDLIDYRAL